MARTGRRFVIGAPGPLSRDETLGGGTAGGFSRGEVSPYRGPTPEQIAEGRSVAASAAEAADAAEMQRRAAEEAALGAIILPGPSGEAGSDTGAPPGDPTGDSPSDSAPSDPTSARGRKVTGSEKEHPITAQAGEWIIQESAVKKYGDKFMEALNAGKIPVMSAEQYARGGKVGAPRRAKRYA